MRDREKGESPATAQALTLRTTRPVQRVKSSDPPSLRGKHMTGRIEFGVRHFECRLTRRPLLDLSHTSALQNFPVTPALYCGWTRNPAFNRDSEPRQEED